jgi:hypothetical protein
MDQLGLGDRPSTIQLHQRPSGSGKFTAGSDSDSGSGSVQSFSTNTARSQHSFTGSTPSTTKRDRPNFQAITID